MQKTQWLTGIRETDVLEQVSRQMPMDIVSTSYILIEHEAPSGVDVSGYVDTSIIKGFNTKLDYLANTLIVYVNGEVLPSDGIIETGPNSYTVQRNYKGYMTVYYAPKDTSKLYGTIDTKSDLTFTTNPVLRYIDISTEIIDQMRYALNKVEELSSLQQTRWCGGFYSDEFALAHYDEDNENYYSNLRPFITEITPQLVYELLNGVSNTATNIGVQLGETYDIDRVYSKLGIEYPAIEFVRRHINTLEASIEV